MRKETLTLSNLGSARDFFMTMPFSAHGLHLMQLDKGYTS